MSSAFATEHETEALPRTSTALRLHGEHSIDALTYDTVAVPPPARGEVLVAIKAVSLNYRDLLIATNTYGFGLSKAPVVLASDGAGEVIAIGEGVERFSVGDRVAGSFFQGWFDGQLQRKHFKTSLGGSIDGVLTTARVFHERGLVRIPEHLSYEEGATLPCAAVTAWQALVSTAHVKSGDTVVVLGTGGVSIFALQFAKLHGARVILTSSSDEKLALAKTLGADETINYRTTPEWQKEVLRLTDGEGADIVIEVGGAGTLARSIESVRPGGQVSLIGILSGTTEPLNVRAILPNVRVQGIYVGSVAMFEEMNRAIALSGLRPVIDRVFPFEQAREALHYLEAAGHFGKVVSSMTD
jgi:NADPH:quinone reductase-like Zn-dependent oxidoreductase